MPFRWWLVAAQICPTGQARARQTCSSVISGFSPPKPQGMQRQRRSGPPDTTPNAAWTTHDFRPWEFRQPDFPLATRNTCSTFQQHEGHHQHPSQPNPARRELVMKYFFFPGFSIPSQDQPVGAVVVARATSTTLTCQTVAGPVCCGRRNDVARPDSTAGCANAGLGAQEDRLRPGRHKKVDGTSPSSAGRPGPERACPACPHPAHRTSASRTASRSSRARAEQPGQCRFDRSWTSSGMSASRQRSRSASQDPGRKQSAVEQGFELPSATTRCAVTMPLSALPTQPKYSRCTPGVLFPFSAPLVSSRMPTVPLGSGGRSATAARNVCCRPRSGRRGPTGRLSRNCCRLRGGVPAYWARGSAVFPARSVSNPRV